ncbi:MAG: COG1361 S-layer family protein [Halodesulfurarchaeum sp.]
MTRRAFIFGALVVASLLFGPGTVAATEDPHFETHVRDDVLPPGQPSRITVILVNDLPDPDERVETAHDLTAEMHSGSTPLSILSGTRVLGRAPDGTPLRMTVTVDVPQDVESGRYRIPIDLTYAVDGERESTTVYATIEVADRPAFAVTNVTAHTRVGTRGTVTLSVTNVGSETATDAVVSLASKSPAIVIGTSGPTSRHAGRLHPGETTELVYEVHARRSAESRPYALTATVVYDNADGDRRHSTPLSASVTPLPAGRFSVRATSVSLAAGSEGAVSVAVTNHGLTAVEQAVMKIRGLGPGLHPETRHVAIGALSVGETKTATVPIDVTEDAATVSHRFEYVIGYDTPSGDRATSIVYGTQVRVAPDESRFSVRVRNGSVPAGGSATVTLSITNLDDGPITDVSAKAYTDAPYSVTDDTSFVGHLAPNESATVRFEVAVPADTAGKQYPLTVDFQYEQPDGDTVLSDQYDVPIAVTRPSGPAAAAIALAAGIALVIALAAGYWYIRD